MAQQQVNYDRVYEVYRWWVRKGPNGGNRDPNKLTARLGMGAAEQELLLKIVDQGGTFQPAFDYRQAQKSGGSAEELAKFAPDRVGFTEYTGRPVTRAERLAGDAAGIDVATLGTAQSPLPAFQGPEFGGTASPGSTVLGGETSGRPGGRSGRAGGRPGLGPAAGGSNRTATPRQGGRPGLPGAGGRTGTVIGDDFPGFPGGNGEGLALAQAAALRQRRRAQRGGRQSTILGGFGSGRPTTRPATLLGT